MSKVFFSGFTYCYFKKVITDLNTFICLVQCYSNLDFHIKYLLQSIIRNKKKIDYDIYLNTKVFCHSYIFKLFQYSRFSRFEFSSQEVPMIIRTIKNREQNSKIAITTPLSGEIFPNSMRTCWLYPKRYRIFFSNSIHDFIHF